MSILSTFHFESYEIRFVNDKPVANDVALALGYAQPQSTISKKVSSKNKGVADLATPGGVQSVMVLEEAGVYQLIFGSNMPNAEKFQDWVFEEVLPSIRKTGKYELLQPKPQTQAEMFLASAQLLVDIERRQLALEAENEKIKAELAEQKETAEVHELEIAANAAELERFKNGHGAWFSIIGYRKLKGLEPISTKQAANLGRKASALCKLNNIKPEKITDPRFGTVGVYPDWILSEVVI